MLALDIRELPVRLHLGPKPPIPAVLFLHRHGPRGQEGLLERLCGPEAFIPFRGEEGRIHLVARAAIAYLESDEIPEELAEMAALMASKSRLRVRMRSGPELIGTILVLLPDNRNRLLDYLNQKDDFFALSIGSGVAVMNKNWIESVEPLAEES